MTEEEVLNDMFAFPFRTAEGSQCVGMTLRDHFAGVALPVILEQQVTGATVNMAAQVAYQVADAMLKARGQ